MPGTPDDRGPECLLSDLDRDEHFRDPETRQRYVTALFDVVAPRYDRFTRVFSFGMDRGWKRELLAAAAREAPARAATILDLACGTGDLALGAASRVPAAAAIVGVDLSRRMLALARRRVIPPDATDLVRFAAADVLRLPLRTGSVDIVTAGYCLRNVPHLAAALREITRALRAGGLLLTLDFYRPPNAWWRRLFLAYLRAAGNLVGFLWHRRPAVYGYIAHSLEGFVTASQFSDVLETHGLQVMAVRPKLFGGICLHVARRAP